MGWPTEDLMYEAKHVLRYMVASKDLHLSYTGGTNTPHAYSDSDWGVEPSITGYVVVLNGSAVAWKSVKQKCIAMSSTEAELLAANAAASELVYVSHLVADMTSNPQPPATLHVDNEGAVKFASEPQTISRMKHIQRHFLKIREFIEAKSIKVQWEPTATNMADVFTKYLQASKFAKLVKGFMAQPNNKSH